MNLVKVKDVLLLLSLMLGLTTTESPTYSILLIDHPRGEHERKLPERFPLPVGRDLKTSYDAMVELTQQTPFTRSCPWS